jgi:Uma2 family endonuclease
MALPEDTFGYELIGGELIVNPTPPLQHQMILGKVLCELGSNLKANGIGAAVNSVDVVLSPETVIQPDVIVILNARASIIGPKNIQGPPNIAVEVLSDDTRLRDETVKRRLCETFGVDEYWVVDPENSTVKLYRRSGAAFASPLVLRGGDAITSPLLPELMLPLSEVFSE